MRRRNQRRQRNRAGDGENKHEEVREFHADDVALLIPGARDCGYTAVSMGRQKKSPVQTTRYL